MAFLDELRAGAEPGVPLLLRDLGLVARYGLTGFLEELARTAEADDRLGTVFLIVPQTEKAVLRRRRGSTTCSRCRLPRAGHATEQGMGPRRRQRDRRARSRTGPAALEGSQGMKPLDVGALKDGLRKLHARLTEDLVQRADQRRVVRALRSAFEKATKDRRTGEDFALGVVTSLRRSRRRGSSRRSSCGCSRTEVCLVGDSPARATPDARRARRDTLGELAPHLGARELLLLVFQELMTFDAVAPLFDPAHNLAWRLAPFEAVARELIAFWETPDPEDGERLRFAFDRERSPTTRFLGDVYEELDPDAKKRFALLQTPTSWRASSSTARSHLRSRLSDSGRPTTRSGSSTQRVGVGTSSSGRSND